MTFDRYGVLIAKNDAVTSTINANQILNGQIAGVIPIWAINHHSRGGVRRIMIIY